MTSIKIPSTPTALDKQLSDQQTKYYEITLCRGTLLILQEQKTTTFHQLELNLPNLTGFIPTTWILRKLLTTLEACGHIQKIPAIQLAQYQGEPYELARQKHRQYVRERPGLHKSDPNSIHDGIAYYFITHNGEKKVGEIKKNFPEGIAFKPSENYGTL